MDREFEKSMTSTDGKQRTWSKNVEFVLELCIAVPDTCEFPKKRDMA